MGITVMIGTIVIMEVFDFSTQKRREHNENKNELTQDTVLFTVDICIDK